MRLRNADGTPVDPVPFIVAALTAFLVTHAWGPLYLQALGLALAPSLVVLTVVWLSIVALAYRQLIRENRPERRRQVPLELRVKKLAYAIVLGILLLLLLTLPFLL